MRNFEASLRLDASATRVWQEMADVVSWPQWMTTFTCVEAWDGRELEPGRRFKVFQPKLRPALWTVTRLSPTSGFTWESRSPGISMTAHHLIEPGSDGTTLRLEFCFDGLLSPVVARFWGKLVQGYLQRECAAYRDRIQTRTPTAAAVST
jgi:uncharacterized membrane protein